MGDNTSKLYKLNKTSTTAPEYFSNHSGGLPIPVSLFIFALHRRRISFHFCQEPRWNFFARPCRPARDFPKKSDISELCAKEVLLQKNVQCPSSKSILLCFQLSCVHSFPIVATLCTENIDICPEYAFNFGRHAL